MKISEKYRKKSEIYKLFSPSNCSNLDFSDKSLEECFLYESKGIGNLEGKIFNDKYNGYYIGKKWMDWHIFEWKKDIKAGLFYKFEFYGGRYPNWWIDKIFKDI